MSKNFGESTTASATYAGFSERNLEEVTQGSIVVFGAPTDSTLPRRSGCSNGPKAIRQATMNALTSYFNSPSKTVVSLDTGKTTRFRSEVIGIDLGDLADCTEVTIETLKQVEQLTAGVHDQGGLPVLLGGDGRILEGLITGLQSSSSELGLLVISNRLDIPRVNGLSSKALSSLLSVSPNSENYPLLIVGANGIQPHENWKEIKKIHGNVISAEDIHEQGVEVALNAIQQFSLQNNQILCVIDAEVLDTGYAAGTPGLNVGGLTPLQLIEILSKANLAPKLVGTCVSNVAPLLDARGHSQYATAEALLAVLGERLFEEIS
jgi:agmatinase